jgi:hypothetical protein
MERIPLTKLVFEKRQYEKVIPTQFTQLTVTNPQAVVTSSLPTISQFFDYYNQLFFEIPQFGSTNSHEYLIQQSTDYIGGQLPNEDIQALLDEIDSLRTVNLELNQQLINAVQSGSNAAVI